MMTAFSENPEVTIIELTDLVDMRRFNHKNYRVGEENIIRPQLIRLGYEVAVFYTVERDEFGPLTRGVRMTDESGQIFLGVYG